MEEEDDSGYEARSTVTTSNSIYQTDLQQLVYYNNLNSPSTNSILSYSRPATVTNYSSNYSSNSLTISTPSYELSPQTIGSRPQSSTYSTISSCSLNRIYQPTLAEQQQQYPRFEEYQPLDQFRLLERVSDNQLNNQPFNNFNSDNQQTQISMSTNRSLNSSFRQASSPDYEQDWSAGEQYDSDYAADHVRSMSGRQILSSPTNSSGNFKYSKKGEDDDVEQNTNDVDDCDEKDNRQLVKILNSPLDRSPFSSPLSLPSSNLSNSNESNQNSNNSSPTTCLKNHFSTKKQQTKLNLPIDHSLSSTPSLESSKPLNSLHSPQSLHLERFSSPKQVKPTCSTPQSEWNEPISEEEFTSRKTALRERINNTFRILNNINKNCNRFRTITSRSQELLNQRRQAELEIDNIVKQTACSSGIGAGNIGEHFRSKRDSKSATIEDNIQNIIDDNETREKLNDNLNSIKLDRIQSTPAAGDTTTTPNKLTIELSNHTSSTSNSNYKDTAEHLIDHLNKSNEWMATPSKSNILGNNNEANNSKPKNKPQMPGYSKRNEKLNKLAAKTTNDNQLLLSINTSRSSTATDHKSSILNSNSPEQLDQNLEYEETKKNCLDDNCEKVDSTDLNESQIKIDNQNSQKSELDTNEDTKSVLKNNFKRAEAKELSLRSQRNTMSDSAKSDQETNEKVTGLITPVKSEPKFRTLKNSYKNSKLKNNLNDIKSDLNDLNDLLNTPQVTTSSSTLKNNTNFMSFVVQPKSVNTDIDSRLMDHILAKICAQRDDEASKNTPSTSSGNNQNEGEKESTREKLSKEQKKENLHKDQPSTKNEKESANDSIKRKAQKMRVWPESKHCQTDKIQNQDASVCVNENDLKSDEKNQKRQTTVIRGDEDLNDKRKSSTSRENDGTKCGIDECTNKIYICDDCKQKCNYTRPPIELNQQSDNQQSSNHCCLRRSHDSCSSFFHHFHPVFLHTFNNNTFTSMPNLTQSLNRIEQGTNTDSHMDQIEVQSIKKDKQTQCILGLSIEEQRREYIENQQLKYLRLKSEKKLNKINDNLEAEKSLPDKQTTLENSKIKDAKNIEKESDEKVEFENEKVKSNGKRKKIGNIVEKNKSSPNANSVIFSDGKISENFEQKNLQKIDAKGSGTPESYQSKKSGVFAEIPRDANVSESEISSDKKKEFIVSSDEESLAKDEIQIGKDENSILSKSTYESESSSELDTVKKVDVTLPMKLPFEHETSKVERKLLDSDKEKKVKTHSKIIIEFSGQSKRERSAVDSFTRLDKDGRLTKKTLVSNTKEINVSCEGAKLEDAKKSYPLSSTPEKQPTSKKICENSSIKEQLVNSQSGNSSINQLVSNENKIQPYRNQNDRDQISINQWKEASHSEIRNEMQTDPLFDENNKAHPTRSVTLSTITTFDHTARGKPQRIDHSNKYQRFFENSLIHEPVIESNLTMLDESNQSNQDELSSSNQSLQTSIENLNVEEEDDIEKDQKFLDNRKDERTNLRPLLCQQEKASTFEPKSTIECNKSEKLCNESRLIESRMSNESSSNQSSETNEFRNVDGQETNLNSRSGSRVSFNLPVNHNSDEEGSTQTLTDDKKLTPDSYLVEDIIEADLNELGENKLRDPNNSIMRTTKEADKTLKNRLGVLETELDDHLFYSNNRTENDDADFNDEIVSSNEQDVDQANEVLHKRRSSKPSKSTRSKEKKSKSSKRKSNESQQVNSDQSSLYSAQTTQPGSTVKQFHDSGFLSPEIYHSSPYEMAYEQVNKDKNEKKEKKIKRDKRTGSSSERQKIKSNKNLFKNENGLKFTEHSSNTEIITRLTKTSYPSKYSEEQSTTEKSLKNLKRNKMVLDQILNSPEIKSSSAKKTSRNEKKKKSGCKISSQITMDLPVYKEEKSISKTKTKSMDYPLKSVSLEELDKERDLDRKSIISQHSYSQQSGEFNTMTKFQKYKPSSKSKKNKSALLLNQPPDETNWEYTMQCNCVNGSKANVLTNVKHRRLLFFPLQQYETSL